MVEEGPQASLLVSGSVANCWANVQEPKCPAVLSGDRAVVGGQVVLSRVKHESLLIHRL